MVSFFLSLAILVAGYFIYGKYISKVLGINPNAKTPAQVYRDDVDYVPLPTWRVFLIQFLNIAGLGPIFGAIMGVQYGPASFLWIALGSVFAGGVHDFVSGMMSEHYRGTSLPEMVGIVLGNKIRYIMRIVTMVLLLLLGAVFVLNSADIIHNLTNFNGLSLNFWIIVIFVYYILATMLPIDKLIGKIYPIFGIALLFMAGGIFVALMENLEYIPEFTDGLHNRYSNPDLHPLFPMMFVSIACGAISGFHASQSPLMARCLNNEKNAQVVFYGAMVCEGVVALIWAAATIAFFKGDYGMLGDYMSNNTTGKFVNFLSTSWLGALGGVLAVIGVVVAPITSGDTAMRAARLIVEDILMLKSKKTWHRIVITLSLFAVAFVIMQINYQVMWRYFGWFNQTLAVFALWACTAFLMRRKSNYFVTLIPAIFMTMVCALYILVAPEGITFDSTIVANFVSAENVNDVTYNVDLCIAGAITLFIIWLFWNSRKYYDRPDRIKQNH